MVHDARGLANGKAAGPCSSFRPPPCDQSDEGPGRLAMLQQTASIAALVSIVWLVIDRTARVESFMPGRRGVHAWQAWKGQTSLVSTIRRNIAWTFLGNTVYAACL